MGNEQLKKVEELTRKFMVGYDAELAKYQPERDRLLEQKDQIDKLLKKMEREAIKKALELLGK